MTTAVASYDSWQLVLLTAAASSNGAVCLDGSPAGYYIERGDPKRWMIHLQAANLRPKYLTCRLRH